MDVDASEELTPLRFSQFPGVPPFLNYIVAPGDVPLHPPPILRSLINKPQISSVEHVVLPKVEICFGFPNRTELWDQDSNVTIFLGLPTSIHVWDVPDRMHFFLMPSHRRG